MDAETRWSLIEGERLRLADLLAGLGPEQWEHPSLCSQWRVRDVAAHVAMTPREPRPLQIAVGLVRARGDLWAFGRDIAREHATRPTLVLVAELRCDAAARTLPVVTNAENALLDLVVHAQDIARPLGIQRRTPPAAAVAAFERAWAMGWPFHARRRHRGLRLVADDAEVDVGAGALVEGHLDDLLLLISGRTAAAAPRLRGPGLVLLPA